MARVTTAMLMAEIAALKAQIASAPAQPVKASTWKSRADRAAGNGYACTANPPCSRHDLRTPKNAGSHVLPNGHTAR